MDSSALLTGVNMLKLLKEMTELASNGKKSEALDRVIEVQQQVAGILEENARILHENKELRERLRLHEAFERREGVLWLDGKDGKTDPGPYCTACWDIHGLAVRINMTPAGDYCPKCQQGYDVSDETRQKHGFPEFASGSSTFRRRATLR